MKSNAASSAVRRIRIEFDRPPAGMTSLGYIMRHSTIQLVGEYLEMTDGWGQPTKAHVQAIYHADPNLLWRWNGAVP